eukprot:jgi/Ulvmu1/1743/UM117_0020.1
MVESQAEAHRAMYGTDPDEGGDGLPGIHVRCLRLYVDLYRLAHPDSTPAVFMDIIHTSKAIMSNAAAHPLLAVLAALRRKGTIHLMLNQSKRALSTAEQIIRMEFDWAYGHLLKADALLGLGQYARAAHTYALAEQLMPAADPTDDFGRPEVADQKRLLNNRMAGISCQTLTPAHASEITAVACWPPHDLPAAPPAAPVQRNHSARSLQDTVNHMVNDALEAISHDGAMYVQLPPPASPAPNPPSAAPPVPTHAINTIDQFVADEMRKKCALGDPDAVPLRAPARHVPHMQLGTSSNGDYLSMLDTGGSTSTTATAAEMPLRTSTIELDLKTQHSTMPGSSTRSPSPLRISEQDADANTCSLADAPPLAPAPTPPGSGGTAAAAPVAAAPPVAAGGGAMTGGSCSAAGSTARLNHLRAQLTTASSEAASTASLPWSTITRTETQALNHQFMATGDLQGTLRVWDVAKMECANELSGHSTGVTCITFAPTLRKGRVLLMASADAEGGVVVWALDLQGGLIESHPLDGHSNRVVSMRFFERGHKLITSSVDTSIVVWNVATGLMVSWLEGHKRAVTSMDSMPYKGKVELATCSVHGTWYLWDIKLRRAVRTGNICGAASIVRFTPYINSLSPPRPLLVTAHWSAHTREASVHLWDVFDPEYRRAAVASGGSAAARDTRLWHSFTGVARGQVRDVAFTVDGAAGEEKVLMAVAALDGSLVVLDLAAKGVLAHMTDGHMDEHQVVQPIHAVEYTRDGKLLMSCGADCSVKVWSTTDMENVLTLLGHSSPIMKMAKVGASELLGTASESGELAFWDLRLAHDLAQFSASHCSTA